MRPMRVLVAVLPMLAAVWSAAAEAGGSPDLIEALRGNGAQILPLGSRGGLDGYFVTPAAGGGYSLYVTGDGHAVAGMLYGPDGTEITGEQLAAADAGDGPGNASRSSPAAFGEAPAAVAHAAPGASGVSFSAPDAVLFERSAAAFGFTLGERGPLAVLFGDALCPWSRSAVARLGREALAGKLRLRVVPVAVLGAAAARLAAGIAAGDDPARAWFEGAVGPANRRGAERIARNNALFDEWGADAVPLTAWRGVDGAVVHRVGDIDDIPAWLRETLGPETLGPQTLGPDTLGVGGGP